LMYLAAIADAQPQGINPQVQSSWPASNWVLHIGYHSFICMQIM
jgi:hypothetical protein